MKWILRTLTPRDLPEFEAHFTRHCAESGRGDPHFMPFAPGGADGPTGLAVDRLERSLTTPGWQRWFVATGPDDPRVLAHVNLKGDGLKTGLHRCELGIGVEREHRGAGLGRQLLHRAIDFARAADTIAWIELRVFSHNTPARALYVALGFREVGTLVDRFRIEGDRIDDVLMVLEV